MPSHSLLPLVCVSLLAAPALADDLTESEQEFQAKRLAALTEYAKAAEEARSELIKGYDAAIAAEKAAGSRDSHPSEAGRGPAGPWQTRGRALQKTGRRAVAVPQWPPRAV